MMLNRLIAFSLRRRVLVLVCAAFVCAWGLYALTQLPVDILPDLNRPTVAVMTEAPGLQPEEIEAQITAPLEAALAGATGSTTIRSVSSTGYSLLNIEFAWGSDVYRNRQIVQERIAQLAATLPGNARPVLLADASLMGEILLIGVVPADASEPQLIAARNFADWTLRPKLLALPGVAQVSVIGGRRPQVQVLADPLALRDRGISYAELQEALQQAAARNGGGAIIENERETSVVTPAHALTPEAITSALVKVSDGAPVHVGDVAAVRLGTQPPRGDAAVNGRAALILTVQKQTLADTQRVTAEVERALSDLHGTLPPGVTLQPNLFRQADFIHAGVSNVTESLIGGAVLAAMVLMLFLMRLRPVLVSVTTIPVSLLATAAVFKLFGQSINCMTLGGIAIAVGELADDAIVDVENIQRRLAENTDRIARTGWLDAILAASLEVRSAIVYGTALVLLALTPLFLLPGLDGRLFAPLACAYIAAIFMSMLVALTVTPALASVLLSGARQDDAALLRGCKKVARSLYAISIPRPLSLIGLLLLGVVLAVVLAGRLGRDYLPQFNEATLTVQLRAWPGISLAESNRLATQVEALLLSVPEVRTTGRRTGRAELDEHAEGLQSSEIDVTFWSKDDSAELLGRQRPGTLRPREDILNDIQRKLQDVPVLAVAFSRPITHRIDHLLSGVKAPVVLKLRGSDTATLRRLGGAAETLLRSISGVTQVGSDRGAAVARLQVRAKPEAAQFGFTTGGLGELLGTLLNGRLAAPALSARQPNELLLWSPEKLRATPEALREFPLVAPTGAYARLSDVADVIEGDGPAEIRRENGERQVTVSCAIQGRDLGSAVDELQRTLSEKLSLPAGYTLSYGGEFEARRTATQYLWPAALAALGVAVLLLYAHFRAFAPVLLVLLNIPFAFIGGIVALTLAHESLSLASVVGFITLAGIAGRNGVLLISHYYHLINDEGLPFTRETVIRGSQERVAPVLMTALTTGLALLPLLFSRGEPGREILHPLALVVFGGLLTTTLLDFAVTPALFLRFCRGIPLIERLAARAEPPVPPEEISANVSAAAEPNRKTRS